LQEPKNSRTFAAVLRNGGW